jgi:hypothetical protein
MQWDNLVHIVVNLTSMTFLAVVIVAIVRAPAERLGRSRWARPGWFVFAVGLAGFLNGVYIPVGAAVALRHLRHQPHTKASQPA